MLFVLVGVEKNIKIVTEEVNFFFNDFFKFKKIIKILSFFEKIFFSKFVQNFNIFKFQNKKNFFKIRPKF